MITKQLTFTLESLGCSKNQVDSEIMIASLEGAGLLFVREPENADLIIVNTCAFIESAKEESIGTALGLKQRYPAKALILAGCLTQRYALEKELTELDGFLTSLDPHDITILLKDLVGQGKIALQPAPFAPETTPAAYQRTHFLSFPNSVYLKIAEGCNNRCSYCAIPLIKGSLRSRPLPEILAEIEAYLERGIFEFNLVAQDLGSYGRDLPQEQEQELSSLPKLLEKISLLNGDFWIRLLYIHPDRFPWPVLDIMQADKRILPYIDLPFQHAASPILKLMGRKGHSAEYLALIHRIREKVPAAVLRSTFLVGFPGETDAHFKELLDFQQQANLDWLGVFTYSQEEGTVAASLPGTVARKTALQRKRLLERRQIKISSQRLERFAGEELPVLVEEAVQGEDLYLGRAYLQAPEVDGCVVLKTTQAQPGQVVQALITRCNGFDLEAVVKDKPFF